MWIYARQNLNKTHQCALHCRLLPKTAKNCQKKYLRAIYWVLLCTLWAYFTAFVSIMWKIAALSKENKLSQLTLIYQDKLFKLHHKGQFISEWKGLIILPTAGSVLADFWVSNEIDSLNFQHMLLFWFHEASQNLSLFRQLFFHSSKGKMLKNQHFPLGNYEKKKLSK